MALKLQIGTKILELELESVKEWGQFFSFILFTNTWLTCSFHLMVEHQTQFGSS